MWALYLILGIITGGVSTYGILRLLAKKKSNVKSQELK